MLQFIRLAWALMLAIPDLIGIVRWIMQIAREYKEAEERRKFVKEVKEAVREASTNLDTTRLVNIFNPDSAPLPRRGIDAQPDGVRVEKDPKI